MSFLQEHDAGTIYLVGDVIDFWRLRRRPGWSASQSQAVKELIAKAQNGTRILYIPGNHDDEMRAFAGTVLGPVEIRLRAIHETAAGRRFLVIHGDEFDTVIKKARWLAVLGDIAYDVATAANTLLNWGRRGLGLPYWSLSAFLKHKVKNAVEYISRFEEIVAREAEMRGVDGVVCGHIHHAEIRRIGGVLYLNDGDWVESCSALVEDARGNMEILRWADPQQRHAQRPAGGIAVVAAGRGKQAAPVPA